MTNIIRRANPRLLPGGGRGPERAALRQLKAVVDAVEIRATHLRTSSMISFKWEMAPDRNREFKYYRLTAAGKKRLLKEKSKWKQMAKAVAQVMWPTEEN